MYCFRLSRAARGSRETAAFASAHSFCFCQFHLVTEQNEINQQSRQVESLPNFGMRNERIKYDSGQFVPADGAIAAVALPPRRLGPNVEGCVAVKVSIGCKHTI
jgi:hypothetical protein